MSYPRPIEEELLSGAEDLLQTTVARVSKPAREQYRFEILGLVSSKLGGYKPDALGDWLDRARNDRAALEAANKIIAILERLPIPRPLALAALARPHLDEQHKREAGAFYTDFRLAMHLARGLRGPFILDPACGSGMLLAAGVLASSDGSRKRRDHMLAETICGADLSEQALRSTAIVLASMTTSSSVISGLLSRLRKMDSLQKGSAGWKDIREGRFDSVIANPPWERVRLTHHEYLARDGRHQHYGEQYAGADAAGLRDSRADLKRYSDSLKDSFELQGRGDVDLYKVFFELALSLIRPGGRLSILVPAGLIRSQGTQALREHLFRVSASLSVDLFDNKPRFFRIDSRFKFLAVKCSLGPEPGRKILLSHRKASVTEIVGGNEVRLPTIQLRRSRPDYSIPEVRSQREWRLFSDITRACPRLGLPEAGWHPKIVREVDMTLDKRLFQRTAFDGVVPLIEGRMVHQYAVGIKQYVSGAGRRADWRAVDAIRTRPPLRPQFFFPVDGLSSSLRQRISGMRAGFCDISGQTNERTMLSALIPANVVCGNKVPTVSFYSKELLFAWLAVCNSIPFDWLLRRVVTTTVNFFHLMDMPFPQVRPQSAPLIRLAEIGRSLSLDKRLDGWERAELRAEADVRVLRLYNQRPHAMKLILEDFPLLDRGESPIAGESSSTVTRDFLLLRALESDRNSDMPAIGQLRRRVKAARLAGAVPYFPSFLRANPIPAHTPSEPPDHDDPGNLIGRRKEATSAV